MILKALKDYYDRMVEDSDAQMPALGISIESISFALVLGKDGELLTIEDLREQAGKKLRPRKLPVPAAVTRTSGIKANFLWDKASYVFGADAEGYSSKNRDRFDTFKQLLHQVGTGVDDSGFFAVTRFLNNWNCEHTQEVVERFQPWADVCGANLVFRLDGTTGYIHHRTPVQRAWLRNVQQKDNVERIQCLVSGEKDSPLARVHTPIKGVRGGRTSGGIIVSFNKSAFTSYGADKAAVAENSAFAYTTALNALLSEKGRQKMFIGNTSVVFWAECASPAEAFFANLFEPPDQSEEKSGIVDDQQPTGKIRSLLKAIRDGKRAADIIPNLDESVRFFILGLTPNAARISIRFWQVSDLGTLLDRIGNHFSHLAIVRRFENEPEFPPLWRLLCQTASQGKSENVSPVLAGAIARSLFAGLPYPQSLLPVVLGRIRAEHDVTYFRAALLKAYLMRNKKMEVSVSLDPERNDRPYLLGRLFAVLEKAQEEAVPGAKATIKDRYLAFASATPGQVFHMLLKNSANHIAKLRKDPEKTGCAKHFEILTQDIIAGCSDFPATQSAEQQGLFMIGYYHQRKDFFTKKIRRAVP